MSKKDSDDETGDNLISMEQLSDSPESWSENLPGLGEFITKNISETPPAWTRGLSASDLSQIQRLGAMGNVTIINELHNIYDLAYQLGVQEAKEMTRGRYLNVFFSSQGGKLNVSLKK